MLVRSASPVTAVNAIVSRQCASPSSREMCLLFQFGSCCSVPIRFSRRPGSFGSGSVVDCANDIAIGGQRREESENETGVGHETR